MACVSKDRAAGCSSLAFGESRASEDISIKGPKQSFSPEAGLKDCSLLTAPLNWDRVPTSSRRMHLAMGHGEINSWWSRISAGPRRPPWWLLMLFFFFCSLSPVYGVLEMKCVRFQHQKQKVRGSWAIREFKPTT